ncbi:phage tail protein [Erwiniaceae bacterium L1_54_6]|nr:phage tail protein [Erwiniaceae bacterium L1_54_6]
MDRQIVYPGAIPLETDLLNTNKYSMIGLAKLAAAIMGASTYVRGLACTPSSPASMVVNVAAGEIYSLQNVDGTAYSSLAADTTHSILKQGVVMDATAFTLTAPTTAGYSINYLIQATYSDVDSGATVLPYYNAANPSVAYSGPNNSGTAQNTVRSGVCTVAIKTGVAATTGTQTTPSPDTGYTGLYVITVAQGATTVTATNIATYANAPIMPSGGLIDGIQRNTMRYAADSGAANAYVVNINPGILSLSAGMEVSFRAANANTTSSTLNVCGLGAYPVLNRFGAALIAGEIAANSLVKVRWSSLATSWFLVDATSAIPTVPTAAAGNSSTQAASTAFVGSAITNATGRLINVQIFTSSGTYTPTTGTTKIVVEVQGAGGGGGSASASSTSTASVATGGGAGAYAKSILTTVPTSQAVVVGTGGTAGIAGGYSSFGSIVASGGAAGGNNLSSSWSSGVILSRGAQTATASGGNLINSIGGSGGDAIYSNMGNCLSGAGGDSFLSKGAFKIGGGSGNGATAVLGAGGSGANATQTTTQYTGGSGGAGIVIIWEYA